MRKLLFLNSAQRFSDFALLLLRVFVGLFLIWSVWDNITDGARMQEFASFLAKHQFPAARILAPVSAYLQLAIGLGFVLGCSRGGPASCARSFLPWPLPWSTASMACAASSRRAACLSLACTWPRMAPGASPWIRRYGPMTCRGRRAACDSGVDRDGPQYRDQGSYRKCRFVDSKSSGAGKRGPDRDRAGRHFLQLRHGSPQAARVLKRCGRTDFLPASEPDGSERVLLSTVPHFITRDTS